MSEGFQRVPASLSQSFRGTDREDYKYEDRSDDGMFWWRSQNQQTPSSPTIHAILERRPTHLFAQINLRRWSLAGI